ncbi:probable serine/threonine-protein kinase nek3 [Actinia tenebrosa]|uniref:Poly [ADP-ribose] polymerase n=1 Tax=Actinia tenebrosa TaxID=6105 RepID=A0A6P8IN15_ACTTE|nr:probable serine/threonine-protein kinase nek3 [Actinia tenebrosa]
MPTAKKPKIESEESFHPAENDSDDDDDLFISVWDGKSTKKTSSETSTKSKPESLPNTKSFSSGYRQSKSNNSINIKNVVVMSINNPSYSGISPTKLQNQNSSNNNDLNSNTNDYGQTSTGLDSDMHIESSRSKNGSCSSSTKNDSDKPLCSGYSTSDLQNQGSNLDSSTNSGEHASTSGVDSNVHIERSDSKNDLCSSPSDWDKPSCSGINIRDFDLVNLSLETDLFQLKTMFPSLDEEVLKSYLEIYEDIEECVRVVSNLIYGGDDDDDIHINEDIKHTWSTSISASETIGSTEPTVNSSSTINKHENKSPLSTQSISSTKKDKSVDDCPGGKRLKDQNGRSKGVHEAVKSEMDLDEHDTMENKVPLSNNSREIASNLSSSSSLHTMTRSPRSASKKQKPSSKEASIDITNGDIKVNQRDTKPKASDSLPSTNMTQVGIDIRYGNKKVHPSMKRCVDRSVASRDIAKPYTGGKDVKAAPNSINPRSETSADVKCTLDNSNGSSPSKRVCKDSISHTMSSNSHTISYNSRGAGKPSRTSSTYSISNSSPSNSPSVEIHDQCSTHNSPSTSTYIPVRSSDAKGSPSASRNSSDYLITSSPSKKTPGKSSTHGSPNYSSSTDDFRAPSTSTSTSDYSSTNSSNRCQSSALVGIDFSSFINSVSRKMLESQGSLSNYSTAGMPSKKGKSPSFPPLMDTDQGIHIGWGNIVRNMNETHSSSTTNTQPQTITPIPTTSPQSTGVSLDTKTNNENQNRPTTAVGQEDQNQSSSAANATQNRFSTGYLNPEQIVLVVEKKKPDTSKCVDLPSEPQSLAHSSQPLELSEEEDVARKEMLDLQMDTEMLAKVCPESDPNYIFSRLEELKDKPNRVAIVNKELIENASTMTSGVENVIKKQKKVAWFWEDKKMRSIPFSRAESNIIESEYTKHGNGSFVNVKFSPETLLLWFDFNAMTVKETLRNKVRNVYRTETLEEIVPGKNDKREETGLSLLPLSNPETWHGHDSTSTNNASTATTRELFEVLPGTSEFAHVDGLLKKSLAKAVIKKIKRVKNDWLERKYGIQRALLREKNGPAGINEMELFHGTRQTPPSVVWNSEEGFDMRYSADGMWGRGCYFAVHAAYSHHQFTYQYIHKEKRYYQIFLAHVLTGESINMNPDRSIRKPPLNAATSRHYDSVTGITKRHRIYVLYKNEASFPAYLITYSM